MLLFIKFKSKFRNSTKKLNLVFEVAWLNTVRKKFAGISIQDLSRFSSQQQTTSSIWKIVCISLVYVIWKHYICDPFDMILFIFLYILYF